MTVPENEFVSDPPLEDKEPDISSADIRLAAMDLLARREHSRLELQRKLKRRFGKRLSASGGEHVIDLESQIDDQLLRLEEEELWPRHHRQLGRMSLRGGSHHGAPLLLLPGC